MQDFDEIKELMNTGRVAEAIVRLKEIIGATPTDDQAHYLLGNAYCRLTDWRNAIASYGEARELNPHSPAVEAEEKVKEILNFYCHDLYNP